MERTADKRSMFETLMELPLFRGASRQRIADVVGMAKFHFVKFAPGDHVLRAGETCTHIKFILSGKVRLTISNADSRFSVSQTLEGPAVISPDFLFGRATNYPCTGIAETTASILQIEKSEYLKILHTDSVFLINYLNYLSMNAQKAVDGVLSLTMGSIEERIALWIVALTQPTGTNIELQCRRCDLHAVLGVTPTDLALALESMKARGLIDYEPGRITIPDRRSLSTLLLSHRV